MKDRILIDILKNRFNYCHVLELGTVYELEECISTLVDEFIDKYEQSEILKFFNTITIYHLEDETLTDEENEKNADFLYNLNIKTFIKENCFTNSSDI